MNITVRRRNSLPQHAVGNILALQICKLLCSVSFSDACLRRNIRHRRVLFNFHQKRNVINDSSLVNYHQAKHKSLITLLECAETYYIYLLYVIIDNNVGIASNSNTVNVNISKTINFYFPYTLFSQAYLSTSPSLLVWKAINLMRVDLETLKLINNGVKTELKNNLIMMIMLL